MFLKMSSDEENDAQVPPCPNHELCQHTKVPGMGSPFCMTCGSWFKIGGFGWDKLQFRDTDNECTICCENRGREMKFPTNCGHWFCIPCSRDILFWDETRYHVNPVPYGCPPCAHSPSCQSRPCNESDDLIVESWEISDPDRFREWKNMEDHQIEHDIDDDSCYASKTCPLCRCKYAK